MRGILAIIVMILVLLATNIISLPEKINVDVTTILKSNGPPPQAQLNTTPFIDGACAASVTQNSWINSPSVLCHDMIMIKPKLYTEEEKEPSLKPKTKPVTMEKHYVPSSPRHCRC